MHTVAISNRAETFRIDPSNPPPASMRKDQAPAPKVGTRTGAAVGFPVHDPQTDCAPVEASDPQYKASKNSARDAQEDLPQPPDRQSTGPSAKTRAARPGSRRTRQAGKNSKTQRPSKQVPAPDAAKVEKTQPQQPLFQAARGSEIPGRQHSEEMKTGHASLLSAAGNEDTATLTRLLDAHPHAARNPADRSAGTAIFNFFRKVASWFGSDAVKWQRSEGKKLLQAVAGVGNAKTMEIVLARGFDLVGDRQFIKQALEWAVTCNNLETTAVLLKKVLSEEPDYVDSFHLTTMAALAGNAGVLNVSASNGMKVPGKIK